MRKFCKLSVLKQFLLTIIVFMTGCLVVVFSVLYLQNFRIDLSNKNLNIIISFIIFIIVCLSALVLSLAESRNAVFKLSFFVTISICVFTIAIYFLKINGFFDKIKSISALKQYINSFGNKAIIIFIILQFLQVVVLPIPSFITVGVGVILFGPLKCATFSFVGIFLGSIVAYCVGRCWGTKIVKWIIGEKSFNKIIFLLNGKSEFLLTVMLLLPFFPDDALCFVAGVTHINPKFYFVMTLFARLVTIFFAAYSINNNLIPYDTWWGALIWILFFILVLFIVRLLYKKLTKFKSK